MKVLVIGGGGREHAMAWKISKSPLLTELYCIPGNPGTASFASNVDLNPLNPGAVAVWAVEQGIDLTVVGPEAPLAAGIVDVFQEHGLHVFGPTKAAARLESSKAFSKEVMLKAGVKTPKGKVFDNFEEAESYIKEQGAPIVIKADGLAAGKGVTVAQTLDEALEALKGCMLDKVFGDSGSKVVIEECLIGREASVIAIVDNETVLPLVVSQDYKRVGDGDQGPNTGGMGAISPTDVLADKRVENLIGDVFIPVVRELSARGIRYRGFLYAGMMVDEKGDAYVIEFNCRLGDPETEVLMLRLKSDLLKVLVAAVEDRLPAIELLWTTQAAACVVAASRGYPGELDDGKRIEGLFAGDDTLQVFHSGTISKDGEVFSKGGRVLVVSALGDSVKEAVAKAYQGLEKISFEGMQYRNDIGGA